MVFAGAATAHCGRDERLRAPEVSETARRPTSQIRESEPTPSYLTPPGPAAPLPSLESSAVAEGAAAAPTQAPALQWPTTARWKTTVTGDSRGPVIYDFVMRRVGGSPEFRFSAVLGGPRANALVLGEGLFWWLDGATLGLKYRRISGESKIPPPVFSERFLSLWNGTEIGLETVERQALRHFRGSIQGEVWDIWVTPSLVLPPVRMTVSDLTYDNREIEAGVPLGADLFSPAAGIDFPDAGAEWRGIPATQADHSMSDQPMRVGGDVRAPVAVFHPDANYPEAVRRARMEGVVAVEAVIGEDGLVRDARVIRPVLPLLDDEALKTVRTWRFKPATFNGRPVSVYLDVQVTFRLH